MKWLRRVLARTVGALTARAGDAEFAEEIRSHLEMQADENVRRGMTPEAARRAAVLKFGSLESAKESYRERRGVPALEHAVQDLRYAARQMTRAPVFALTAVATLAVGIGANTAVFSIVNAVLLTDLPYPAPGELVMLTQSLPAVGEGRLGVSPPEYLDYRDRTRAFAAIAGYTRATFDLNEGGETESIAGVQANATLFPTLGVPPYLGRTFTPDEEETGKATVAVLSFDFWRRRFLADPEVVGKALRLNERAYTVIGVMPDGFEFPAGHATVQPPPALWVPLAYTPRQLAGRASSFDTRVIARLASGMSLERARRDVARVAEEFQRDHPEIYTGTFQLHATVDSLSAVASAPVRPVLLLVAAAVGLVLLIACVNVANLLLVRASARRKELAVRRALGAAPGRIVRQLFTESMLLSACGGVLGVLLAYALSSAAGTVFDERSIGVRGAPVDGTVLLFVAAISVLSGALCGLAPALGIRGRGIADALQRAGRQPASGDRRRLRNALVVAETAAAFVLLVGAALLSHSLVRAMNLPLGFDPEDAMIVRTTFNRERYPEAERRRAVQQQIADRVSALSGVTAVGLTTHVPLADERTIGYVVEPATAQQVQWAANALVSPEYFAAMRIPIVRGRSFNATDTVETPLAAVVNETLARRHWPDRDPIGQRVVWGGRRLTVVGVAGDVRVSVSAEVAPTIYCSVYQVESNATTSAVFVVRRNGDPVGADVRRAVLSIDAGLPVFDVRPLSDVVRGAIAQRTTVVSLIAAFAAIALALAVVGLYAVLSHAVAQRTQELGIRLALGARPSTLMAMVIRDAGLLVGAGLLIGGAAAAIAARQIAGLLIGVGPADSLAFAAAAGMLLLVSLLASYTVARRAAILDPVTALRAE